MGGTPPRLAEMAGVDRDLFTSTDEPELEFDDDGTELSSAKEGRVYAKCASCVLDLVLPVPGPPLFCDCFQRDVHMKVHCHRVGVLNPYFTVSVLQYEKERERGGKRGRRRRRRKYRRQISNEI